jgi:hypothetical protein
MSKQRLDCTNDGLTTRREYISRGPALATKNHGDGDGTVVGSKSMPCNLFAFRRITYFEAFTMSQDPKDLSY